MRDGTAEPVSRDQILRHVRGQGNVHFPCSADHPQDWQPYPVDPYSAICDDHTNILPRVRRHRASKPQVISKRVLPWQVTMDKLIYASLSHTHFWYALPAYSAPRQAVSIETPHSNAPKRKGLGGKMTACVSLCLFSLESSVVLLSRTTVMQTGADSRDPSRFPRRRPSIYII